MNFEEQNEKSYEIYGVAFEDREVWAANMRRQMLEVYYSSKCLTPTTKEEQLSLPDDDFSPESFVLTDSILHVSKDVIEEVREETFDVARKNLMNGFVHGTHVIAPSDMKKDVGEAIVHRHLPESTVQDLVYESEKVVLHTGKYAEAQSLNEVFPIEHNELITGIAYNQKEGLRTVVGESQSQPMSPCTIIPRGEEFAILHYKTGNVDFSVALFADRSYPVQIFEPRGGLEVFFSALCVEHDGLIEGPEDKIGDGKILRMWGVDFQLRSFDELAASQIPSLVHFYDWRKVKALRINASMFPVFLTCIFKVLRIDKDTFACVRNNGKGPLACAGCSVCYQGNCSYVPIFRVPDDFKGCMEFNFFSARFMPSVNCRMEFNKEWHKRYVGFGEGVLIQFSYQVPNTLTDYLDLVELVTVDDLCRTTFYRVYSRLCIEARQYVTLPYFSYPKCGGTNWGTKDLRDRANLTANLMRLCYFPCGRKFYAFNSSVGTNKVTPAHICDKNQEILANGAQMLLSFKTSEKSERKLGGNQDLGVMPSASVKVLKFGEV